MNIREILGIILGWICCAVPCFAAPEKAALDAAVEATGKIIVSGHDGSQVIATGFIFNRADTVVTCMHVVIGAEGVKVIFSGSTREAKVERVLRGSDLAILHLNKPLETHPIKIADGSPKAGQAIIALGYPLAAPVIKSMEGSIRRVGGTTLSDLIGQEELRREITATGFPSLSSPIVDLQISLTPGMSGAPIIDDKGNVVGIGNGGLEKGTTELTWAIAASELEKLLISIEQIPKKSAELQRNTAMFSAELRASTGESITVGGRTFSKLRTRRLDELLRYSDDVLGVHQIAADFQPLNAFDWTFDVYREVDTGAMIVLPEGVKPMQHNNDSLANIDGGSIQILIRFETGLSLLNLQNASLRFEGDIAAATSDMLWLPNPKFTYLQPHVYPSGLIVRRRGYVAYAQPLVPWLPPPFPARSGFETFAVFNQALLSVVALNYNWPAVLQSLEAKRHWGEAMIAIQLASFSSQTK